MNTSHNGNRDKNDTLLYFIFQLSSFSRSLHVVALLHFLKNRLGLKNDSGHYQNRHDNPEVGKSEL